MKPSKPGSYLCNGRPALVGMHKGVLVAGWIDADGQWQKAKVWSKELENAAWRPLLADPPAGKQDE
jgi:hypothetical protein